MKSLFLLLGAFALMNAFPFETSAQEGKETPEWWQQMAAKEGKKPREWWQHYEEIRDEIYARMKRYGINRKDMEDMRQLIKSGRPLGDPHISILAEDLLKPGEHYRFEMDEYIVTMLVPDARPSTSWIYPYTNIRTPDAAMKQYLAREKGSLAIAQLGWTNCVFLGCMNSRGDVSGLTMTYRILSQEEASGRYSSPDNLLKWKTEWNQYLIKQAQARYGNNPIISRAEEEAYQIAMNPEAVTINGRVWIRDAMNRYMVRDYHYLTTLSPGRMLHVRFGMPLGHDYNARPDPATWPGSAKKAYATMEKMLASLRVVKMDDDGTPDPFVIERVESAPLPVREALPADR